MSLNKKKMVREIGRRTRLSNRDVEQVIETLVDVWTEELVSGGRIELENFLVLEVNAIDRRDKTGMLLVGGKLRRTSEYTRRLMVKPSKRLKFMVRGKA